MALPGFSFPSGNGNVEVIADLINGERLADNIHIADGIEDLTQALRLDAIYLDIPVLGLGTHQLVTNAPANEHRTPAFGIDPRR
jgi:hypothetical protein